MAEVVEGIPASAVQRKSRGYKYPWNEWLDGKTRRLTRGHDFVGTIKPSAFKAQFKLACENAGKVPTWGYEGDDVIYIQAVAKES